MQSDCTLTASSQRWSCSAAAVFWVLVQLHASFDSLVLQHCYLRKDDLCSVGAWKEGKVPLDHLL